MGLLLSELYKYLLVRYWRSGKGARGAVQRRIYAYYSSLYGVYKTIKGTQVLTTNPVQLRGFRVNEMSP